MKQQTRGQDVTKWYLRGSATGDSRELEELEHRITIEPDNCGLPINVFSIIYILSAQGLVRAFYFTKYRLFVLIIFILYILIAGNIAPGA